MKNRGTWILFGAVVLLSAYAYFGEYKGKEKDKASKELKSVILKDIKQDQISSIEVNTLDQKIVLNRSTDGWILTSPVADSADNAEIDNWLKQLTEEKSLSIAVEGADIKWQYFGFDKAPKSITIKTTSNQQIGIEVSVKKNFEGNSFIRYTGQNQVLVAGLSWSEHVGKKIIDLRNKKIFRHQISNIQSIQIKNKKNTIEIGNKEAKWLSSNQPSWSLDQNGVRDLITKISDLKAIDFVAEKDKFESTKKELKLGPSEASVSVKLADGEWSATFYQIKDKTLYVEVPKAQLLVKVAGDVFDKVSKLRLIDLRDYRLPFGGFDKTKVEKLSYETSLKKASLEKKNSIWQLEPVDSNNEVQQEKVNSLLDVIKNLVAKQYLAKSEIKKDFGKQKVVFKDSNDKPYFELLFSDMEKKKINNEEKSVRIAKTNLYDEAFIIDESEFEKLNLNDVVRVKAADEGKAKPTETKKEDIHGK